MWSVTSVALDDKDQLSAARGLFAFSPQKSMADSSEVWHEDHVDKDEGGSESPAHHKVVIAAAREEASPITEEEKIYQRAGLDALTPAQREKMRRDGVDVLVIVRGYQSYKPREAETRKFFKRIADWRDDSGFYDFFTSGKSLEHFELFHANWPNSIYGFDDFGHVITGFRIQDVDTDKLAGIGAEQLSRLQGQKMAAVFEYKRDSSRKRGTQRYKHSAIMDLKGLSMSMLAGGKMKILQHLIDVGSHYFPEQMWKIYLVNTPMIFRGVWAMLKPWLHPITVAKVQMLGKPQAAAEAMRKDGVPLSALPDWCGGTCKGVEMLKVVEHYIANPPTHIVPCP